MRNGDMWDWLLKSGRGVGLSISMEGSLSLHRTYSVYLKSTITQ